MAIASLLSGVVAKYLYTTVASTDVILEEIISQRQFEVGHKHKEQRLARDLAEGNHHVKASTVAKTASTFTKSHKMDEIRSYRLDAFLAVDELYDSDSDDEEPSMPAKVLRALRSLSCTSPSDQGQDGEDAAAGVKLPVYSPH